MRIREGNIKLGVDKYKYSEADDLYDQDIPIDRKCPVCKGEMYISPDCVESCSDNSCSFDGIAEYRKDNNGKEKE